MRWRSILLIAAMGAQALVFPAFGHDVVKQTQHCQAKDVIKFAKDVSVSCLGNLLINMALFRSEYRSGQVGFLGLAGISSIEVAKNLANYVLIENESQVLGSVLAFGALNAFRIAIPPNPHPNGVLQFAETAVAEVLKNRLNFVVTEGWYPKNWSRPPAY